MIVIAPPVVKPYAPALQPIATVVVSRGEVAGPLGFPGVGTPRIGIALLDAAGKRITVAPGSVRTMTPDEIKAFLAMPAVPGDTSAQDASRRAQPYVAAAYGLSGTVE